MHTLIKTQKYAIRSSWYAFVASTLIITLCTIGYLAAEPRVGQALTPGPSSFTIKQTITGDVSFLVEPSNVSLTDSISGVTGGTASGTTDFSILSTNATGYEVTIGFADSDTDGVAMQGDTTGSSEIVNYTAGSDTPTYGFSTTTQAQFAYTVYSTTGDGDDTDPNFRHNTTACNNDTNDGDGTLDNSCWKAPSTTAAYRIVDAADTAATGATTTIKFYVSVPSSLGITADTYTATATLTLTST